MNPFAFHTHLLIETSVGVPVPVGYLTLCGIPVFYGLMWRVVHLDTALPRRGPEPYPVI